MKYISCCIILVLIKVNVQSQSFLNGDFEINTAVPNEINLSNSDYDSLMAYSSAFGFYGNMDIISSADYCGLAQSGDWFVALTGGGTDAISLELSAPLIMGKEYELIFYDRSCLAIIDTLVAVEIGVSHSSINFGTSLYIGPTPDDAVWNQRKFTFIAPTNASYITVRGVGPANARTTWSQVDNFSIGCPYPPLTLNLGNDTTLCEGNQLVYDIEHVNATYLWQDNSTNSTYSITQPGTYWVKLTNPCEEKIDSITVNFKPNPIVELGADTAYCKEDAFGMTLDVTNVNATYLWQDNSTDPIFYVEGGGTYEVMVDLGGCIVTKELYVDAKECEVLLEMPNAFTPNSDGNNDYFHVRKTKRIAAATLMIYNRWGQKLYESSDITHGWDGKFNGRDCVEGTYFWSIYYEDIYNHGHQEKGFLTLIR